ncbi:class II peroxidase [Lentithecium fluviatile CBS 122367]|uniref:Peroxidase n=1 Tax=Lentithecium fluviatile CBS 122367 TaxID=1168545 RepID=A0A6G1JEX6_9PLEO|nr:class II peroxidase [Lentithecium fluviatile CBS 122367]
MYISTPLISILAIASTTQALQVSDVQASAAEAKRTVGSIVSGVVDKLTNRQNTCPLVWKEISTTLTAQFLADGQCTDAARAAIRAAFHDCFNGACDGSLILANECSNSENVGLERLCSNLGSLATEKQVGVADLIQFAAAHAIKTCPGGPTVPAKVGRKDSNTANALGILPSGNAKAADLIKLFASKGFSAIDLTALIGAHSTAKQRVTDPSRAGASMDSTPGQWDTKFYSETLKGTAPFTLQSDKNLANSLVTTLPFKTFAASQAAWSAAFVPAMTKMSMLGVSGKLVDCTSALPGGSSKRDVKRSSMFERLGW